MDNLLFSILPLAILLSTATLLAAWGVSVPRRDGRIEAVVGQAGTGLLAVFAGWMILATIAQKQIPILSPGQLMLLMAGMTWFAYSVIQAHIRQRILSVLPLAAILILTAFALISGIETPPNPPGKLIGVMPAIHVFLGLAGTSLLIGNGVFAAGQIILHRQLKAHKYGAWFEKLPSLSEMESLRSISLRYGWALLTLVSIVAMTSMALRTSESKTVISHMHPMLTLWVIAGLLVLADRKRWFSSLKLAVASLTFSLVMTTLLALSLIEIFRGRFL